MTYTGPMRVHFNRHGDWELAVSAILINGKSRTVYIEKSTSDDDDGRPSAWIEVVGTMRLQGSVATITNWEHSA